MKCAFENKYKTLKKLRNMFNLPFILSFWLKYEKNFNSLYKLKIESFNLFKGQLIKTHLKY